MSWWFGMSWTGRHPLSGSAAGGRFCGRRAAQTELGEGEDFRMKDSEKKKEGVLTQIQKRRWKGPQLALRVHVRPASRDETQRIEQALDRLLEAYVRQVQALRSSL